GGAVSVRVDVRGEGASPLSCRGQPPLLRAPAAEPKRVNVTVFGATGVVGRALVPLLGEHELTAVSRTARDAPSARWVVADAASGDGVPAALEGADVVYYLVHSLGATDFEEQDRVAAETVAREAANAGVRQIVYLGGLGADGPGGTAPLRRRPATRQQARTSPPATPRRRRTAARLRRRTGDDPARRDDHRQGERRLRDDPRAGQAAAGDGDAELGLDPDAADRARRRHPLPGRCLRQRGRVRRGLRYARTGGDDLPADDRADRRPARPEAGNRRGSGADAVPLLALAQPRHAGERIGREAAHRRTAQSHDRARGADPEAAPARAHPVRRSGATSARVSSDRQGWRGAGYVRARVCASRPAAR